MKINILTSLIFLTLGAYSQNKTEIYITKYSQTAIEEMNRFGIPASITLAQGILESGNGESRLAKEANNHFGIKCHKNWNGKTISEDDDEKQECFRSYDNVFESYRDHSLFLSERGRYSFLFEYSRTDYQKWAKGLKKAGYATNPNYSKLLIDLIEKYNLKRFDKKNTDTKEIYFAHSYGLPYISSVGLYYFKHKSLFSFEINTSYVFSDINLGYNHNLFSNFSLGSNMGVIYLPNNNKKIYPQLSLEINYKNKPFLFRVGTQFVLSEMNYEFIPYLRVTYFLKR